MSLLELVLAMMLFATIVVFVSSIWGMHARIIGKTRSRMVATFLAEQLCEQAINDGFTAAHNDASSLNITTTMRGAQIVIAYNYTVTVSNHPDYPTKLKVVTVQVRFPTEDNNSAYNQVTYETLLASSL